MSGGTPGLQRRAPPIKGIDAASGSEVAPSIAARRPVRCACACAALGSGEMDVVFNVEGDEGAVLSLRVEAATLEPATLEPAVQHYPVFSPWISTSNSPSHQIAWWGAAASPSPVFTWQPQPTD